MYMESIILIENQMFPSRASYGEGEFNSGQVLIHSRLVEELFVGSGAAAEEPWVLC